MHKIPPPEFFSYNLRLYLFLKCRHKQEWYLIKPNQAFTRQHGGVCKTLKREPGNWEYKFTNPLGRMAPYTFKLFWRGLAHAQFPARQKDNRPRSRTTEFLSTWWVKLLQSIKMFLSPWHSGLPSISVRVLQQNRTSRRLSSSLSIYHLSVTYIFLNEIYYKELAHVIMVAEKSHNLLSVRWRPKKANGGIQSESMAWEPGEPLE